MSKTKPSPNQLLMLRRMHAGWDFNDALRTRVREPLAGKIRNGRQVARTVVEEGWLVFDEAADRFVLSPKALEAVEDATPKT